MTWQVGPQIRDLRRSQRKTQEVVAQLAGISPAYLSMVENGRRSIRDRTTLDNIARALRVTPADLGGVPSEGVLDEEVSRARSLLPAVESALIEVSLGEETTRPRDLPEVLADLNHLRASLKPKADVVGQMEVYPELIRELNTIWSQTRQESILGDLAWLYLDVSNSVGSLGANSTAGLAVMHLRDVSNLLDDPLWIGLSAYGRALGLGAAGLREKAREVSIDALNLIDPSSGDAQRQIAGTLHLTAALSSATSGDVDRVNMHVAEARALAEAGDDPDGTGWAGLCFSRTNTQIWETSLALEAGGPGRALAVARQTRPEAHPSWSRQGAFYGDLARALAAGRRTRSQAVEALVRAEALAPVRTRSNVWLRGTAVDLLRLVRRDAPEGRQLQALARRMSLSV